MSLHSCRLDPRNEATGETGVFAPEEYKLLLENILEGERVRKKLLEPPLLCGSVCARSQYLSRLWGSGQAKM